MWVRRADTVFSPELAIHRMPRNPGEAEHRCPWCTYQTMRWRPVKGIAFCVNPSCRNDDGRRPQWIVEYSVVDDHMEFFWRELMTEAA
jgi:hypothetical protein